MADDTVRVFFSTRDTKNRSSCASIDLAIDYDRFELPGGVNGPCFEPGSRGAFDSDGVTMSSFVRHDGQLYGFYLGWTIQVSVPFANYVGLAASEDDGRTFNRVSTLPILDRSAANPFSMSYPCVLPHGDGWRMWYGTHVEWGAEGMDMVHAIGSADSTDLLTWTPSASHVLEPRLGNSGEFALSRPTCLPTGDGGYHMWFGKRLRHYDIGYAYSTNGTDWHRDDDMVTFEGQRADWECDERSYPAIFELNGETYMLHTGNQYGRTGFGLARLQK